jgi:hypothetical protein
LLRPGGRLLVGLYSALARRSITTARARIADWGYRSSPAHIRECRQELIKRRLQAASPDFFTASGFRDLYLRVAERQFTVADIASWVQVAGVKFRGFEIDDSLREQFDERHHGANSQDLSAWDVFEQGLSARLRQHVPVFGSEAWARKIEQGQGPAHISSG